MHRNLKTGFASIILAGGEGKRMKSNLSKMLHTIAGRPMLARTVEILQAVNPVSNIIVANTKNVDKIQKFVPKNFELVIQKSPLGTADAVATGLKAKRLHQDTVAVMYGDDTAFYKPETILRVFAHHKKSNAKITFVTVFKKNPLGLGRIIREKGKISGIVEEKDATHDQKKINEINDGLYFFDKDWLSKNISRLKPSPVTGELYITDLVEIALRDKELVETYQLKDESQWHGVNTRQELKEANEKLQRSIHVMGAAGAGAIGVLGIAKEYGYHVSGCDLNPHSPYINNREVFQIKKGHDPKHLFGVGKLIVSPAVLKLDPKNREITEALKLKIPILTWQKFQGQFLQKDKFVIAIAGAYGKSTTTAMIAKILIDQKLDPTCEIGAKVLEWKTNFRSGKSKYYVCEADEYNDNFLNYQPDIAVILNVAWDHPDYFKTKSQLLKSYERFIANIKKGGYLVISNDRQLAQIAKSKRADVKLVKTADFEKVDLAIIGDFRKENANVALTVAKILKLNLKDSRDSLKKFTGIGRRLEYKGKINDVKFFDDYAVQPYTVLKTANALKEKFKNKRVGLVFEPHTFSRIRTFFNQFVAILKYLTVDKIMITDVYAAREKGNKQHPAKALADKVGSKAIYLGSIEQVSSYLNQNLKHFDIICSMGAGRTWELWDLIKKQKHAD